MNHDQWSVSLSADDGDDGGGGAELREAKLLLGADGLTIFYASGESLALALEDLDELRAEGDVLRIGYFDPQERERALMVRASSGELDAIRSRGEALLAQHTELDDSLSGPPAAAIAPSSCHVCRRALAEQYFELNGHAICDACLLLKRARRGGRGAAPRMLRAVAYGGCAAGLGLLLFHGLLWVTGLELGFLALLIGFVVGTAVRIGSGGRGGPAYQALAATLMVLAIAGTHLPAVAERGLDRSALSLLVRALSWALVAPFYLGYAALFGTVFALIGLWIAIRLARTTPSAIEGPFELTSRLATRDVSVQGGVDNNANDIK